MFDYVNVFSNASILNRHNIRHLSSENQQLNFERTQHGRFEDVVSTDLQDAPFNLSDFQFWIYYEV